MNTIFRSFLAFILLGSVAFADLIGPIDSDITGLKIDIQQAVTGNSVTLSFYSQFSESFDDSIIIDGLSFELDYPVDMIPSNPLVTNQFEGSLFDPVTFVDIKDFKRATITFYELDLLNEDVHLFDFSFDYIDLQPHIIEIEAEALLDSEIVIEMVTAEDVETVLLDYPIPEDYEEEEDEEEDGDEDVSTGGSGSGSSEGSSTGVLDEDLYEEVCPEVEELFLDHPFVDIDEHYAEGHISGLYFIGAVHGMDATEYFMPDESATRAELLKMSLETLGYDVSAVEPEAVFDDLDIAEWYAPYVYLGYLEEIVEGYEDALFKPGQAVTRAEALKMFLIAGEVDLYSAEEGIFDDVGEDDWFLEVVGTGYDLGIIEGYEDGNFGPNDPITRGQAAIMMLRLECVLSDYYYELSI